MLLPVETPPRGLGDYASLLDPAVVAEIQALADSLRGLRVVHINATPTGGGVAEILHSLIPLSRDVGLDAAWYVLPPDDAFFQVTKRFHNWLQGQPGRLLPRHRDVYERYLERVAASMRHLAADVWVVHDPQPLPLVAMVPLGGTTIWRCHIDCSAPNARVRDYLLPWVRQYDLTVFSMREYVLAGLDPAGARVVHPAIDPLTPKNVPLPFDEARAILAGLGIDPFRPLVTQVSRFDPWKNPWEVIDAYRLAKRQVPELQLALVGVFSARDDPEGPRVYRSVRHHAGADPDIHLFKDPLQVGSREVNAFQSGSDLVLQRSVREGFGLTVTEAMWKARPVVATPVGGITVQIEDGQDGFLVRGAEGCAEVVVNLLRQPDRAHAVGQAAHATVARRFLLPRLLADDLRLFHERVSAQELAPAAERVA